MLVVRLPCQHQFVQTIYQYNYLHTVRMKSILVIAIIVTTAEKVCGGGEERQQLDFSQCCESTVTSVFVSNFYLQKKL